MKLKLCNNGLSVVGVNEKGMFISYSIEAEEYKQWLDKGNIPEPEFTNEELIAIEVANKKQEAKIYLASTDYKMTVDYFATLSKEIQDGLDQEVEALQQSCQRRSHDPGKERSEGEANKDFANFGAGINQRRAAGGAVGARAGAKMEVEQGGGRANDHQNALQ